MRASRSCTAGFSSSFQPRRLKMRSPAVPRVRGNPCSRCRAHHLSRRRYTSSPPQGTSQPAPFTRASLEQIRSLLLPAPLHRPVPLDPASQSPCPTSPLPQHGIPWQTSRPPREAAILIPLINMGDPPQPGFLLELRSSKMRDHAGEVRSVDLLTWACPKS